MTNLEIIQNDQGLIVSEYPEKNSACKELFHIEGEWKLDDKASPNMVLLVQDMQKGYLEWIDYVSPNCKKLVDVFRKHNLPIVWTNWHRTPDDGMYCAIDLFMAHVVSRTS
jgi:isochorismate hydrolase